MKTIRIYCKKCKEQLTQNLVETESKHLRFEDGTRAINSGKFSIYENENNVKEVIVAIEDYELRNHKDLRRFTGCCGSSGTDGMNKTCKNGHEVATEVSDCWTPHYINFDLNNIIIKEVIDDYNLRIMKF
ncbi:hypothetical protein SAMN05444671_2495 [Flavobacterium sp. CF108]|uniref:hypothetical protein n=1 Tax=Flavobacterium TaxID=237 RepID=UPI0008AFA077|nr:MULTISPECIES: hypothetical protein [Flavobacterium]UUF14165.1 hypothetical protein NLJ00_23205 [Flavobacterium panici]SEN93626.1 hypothetical protein SAMN04487978_1811 [Flavobacterium sp. fv08]SHH28040.1 hypothetical protein SAMN05444671_2495 [Flavobacterium sp. CF108]